MYARNSCSSKIKQQFIYLNNKKLDNKKRMASCFLRAAAVVFQRLQLHYGLNVNIQFSIEVASHRWKSKATLIQKNCFGMIFMVGNVSDIHSE